jgi:hypothetical protein
MVYFSFYFNLKIVRFFCRNLYNYEKPRDILCAGPDSNRDIPNANPATTTTAQKTRSYNRIKWDKKYSFVLPCVLDCQACLLTGWGQKRYFETAGRKPNAVSHEFLLQSD